MLKIQSRSSAVRGMFAASALLLTLAACGGSGDAAATPSGSATGSPGANGNGQGGGFGGADFAAMQTCLKAAGIAVPTGMPSGGARPSGSARPSGNGTPPADGVRPSGGAGFGGGGGMFQSKEAQAALKACGITVPTGRGTRPSSTATPTATS
jgi:hypothetical protein